MCAFIWLDLALALLNTCREKQRQSYDEHRKIEIMWKPHFLVTKLFWYLIWKFSFYITWTWQTSLSLFCKGPAQTGNISTYMCMYGVVNTNIHTYMCISTIYGYLISSKCISYLVTYLTGCFSSFFVIISHVLFQCVFRHTYLCNNHNKENIL